jgi:hypothetical protein
VRGGATGVLGPVALELRIDGDSELLAVTQEGTFAFATRLENGASYTVVLVDPDLPCMLRNQTGLIAGADTAIELTCTVPELASVAVSGGSRERMRSRSRNPKMPARAARSA